MCLNMYGFLYYLRHIKYTDLQLFGSPLEPFYLVLQSYIDLEIKIALLTNLQDYIVHNWDF